MRCSRIRIINSERVIIRVINTNNCLILTKKTLLSEGQETFKTVLSLFYESYCNVKIGFLEYLINE